jgi:uncharacterized protein
VSQENVEIVRASVEAWNAGDMDALRDLYHEDAVTRGLDNWPEAGPNVGREAVMRQYARMRESVDTDSVEVRAEPVDIRDRVAVRMAWRATGRGPEVNMEVTAVFTVRDRCIQSVDFFWDHAEALEVLGLAE